MKRGAKSRVSDLTGKKFGKLTAIELAEPAYTATGEKRTTWRCVCDCGNERIVRAAYLRRGAATYCGQCEPPAWLKAQNRICRYCEFATLNKELHDWECAKGCDVSSVKGRCEEFWCAPEDKFNGVKNRQGTCIVCHKPVYANGQSEIPLYCYEHRAEAERDNKIIADIPEELMFSLIEGIFQKARTDYLTNENGMRSDAEAFFRSEWAQLLSLGGFDPEKVLKHLNRERTLREEAANESKRSKD